MLTQQQLFDYLQQQYQALPETLFLKYPDYAVFRHTHNQKWFALFMPVAAEKLGLKEKRILPILNLKLTPELIDILRQQQGYYAAYHMNKQHWISIDLNLIESLAEITPLLEESFQLTR